MATETYELTVFTDGAGRRCVRLPDCSATDCAVCGACAGLGPRRSRAEPLPLDNAAQLTGVPDGARLRVMVERMNPVLLAAALFLMPLAMLAAGGAAGTALFGQSKGLILGTVAGMLAAWAWLRWCQRRWRGLRARGEPLAD